MNPNLSVSSSFQNIKLIGMGCFNFLLLMVVDNTFKHHSFASVAIVLPGVYHLQAEYSTYYLGRSKMELFGFVSSLELEMRGFHLKPLLSRLSSCNLVSISFLKSFNDGSASVKK
mmetsp:Transcript_10915/g.16570  ORF Transcript_10915/g.16570 Transcript_10915/m.16570 type:complete len:115 (-) Transcript_10915:1804-2148(-)